MLIRISNDSQLFEHFRGVLCVFHKDALGDLKVEASTVQTGLAEDVVDLGYQIRLQNWVSRC